MRATPNLLAATLAIIMIGAAPPEPGAGSPVTVTADNYIRAESDAHFAAVVKEGGFGKFVHQHHPVSIYDQTVVRANRDIMHSTAVFDLDAGPVTITLPDPGKRYMSMAVINEDHYIPAVVYGAGSYSFTKQQVGTRYVTFDVRTMVDPENPADIEKVAGLQEGVTASQKAGGSFEIPNWDQASLKTVRDGLRKLGATMPDMNRAFGSKAEVDPVRHLVGTAMDWAGSPDKDGLYLSYTPEKNDAMTIYRLKAKDVPVDGFWSVTLYNAFGYFTTNPLNAYSLSNITAKRGDDGSIEVQFGGCDGTIPNCLPTVPDWNYTVRLYRPRPEILNGTWKFPQAEEVK